MRILFVAPLWYGSTCLQRMESMKDLVQEVVPVDTDPEDIHRNQRKFFYRAVKKVFGPLDWAGVNKKILQAIRDRNFDLLWIEKGVTIKVETIKAVRRISPRTLIVGYSPDNMTVKHNQTSDFLKGLPYYNIYFTPKSYNVRELKELGCPEVVFIEKAYDPHTHYPMAVTENDRVKFGGPVGFIGDWEQKRAEVMLYLATNGIPVRIWGPNWRRKCKLSHPNLRIEKDGLWGRDYARAICCFDINLGFLRKINRDLQTARSVEIPACGKFMLAERTDEHLQLFEEGKEADFFSTKEELLQKIKYYLTHVEERERIAKAGRQRCLKSGYSNYERLKKMLGIIENLYGKKN